MESRTDQTFAHLNDIMGSLPMVKRYIPLCIFFDLQEGYSLDHVEGFLRESLARLTKALPYLAGKVVYQGRDESRKISGYPRIVPHQAEIQLITKDLRKDTTFPSLDDLTSARYPFSTLDPDILVTPVAVSWSSDNDYNTTAPIFMVQANFIRDGLILTVMGNHTQMDMTGEGIVISHLAQACRKESFTDDQLRLANQPRIDAITLLDNTYQPGPEVDDIIVKPPNPDAPNPLDSNPSWTYFHLSPSSLSRLKSLASQQAIVPYISTDDAIGALFWQRLIAVRSTRTSAPITSTFARPASARSFLNLKQYIGHMVDTLHCTLQAPHLLSLGTLAANLRLLLSQPETIVHHVRAFATLLARLDDKSTLINGAKLDPSRDIVLSSYANIRCCDLGFGELGRPVAVRRPRMPVWPGLCYCMPKDQDGGIAVAVCVGEEDLDGLRKDEVLGEFAEFVG